MKNNSENKKINQDHQFNVNNANNANNSNNANRVVVTGMSIVSPIAIGVDEYFNALKNATSGITTVSNFDASSFPISVAGEIKNKKLIQKLNEKNIDVSLMNIDRKLVFLLLAFEELLTNNQINNESKIIDMIIGTGIEEFFIEDAKKIVTKEKTIEELKGRSPYIIRAIEDYPTFYLNQKIKLKGVALTNVSNCAASAQAIGIAYQRIKHGLCEQAIVGGVDSMLNPFGLLGFTRLGALSERGRCSPFDSKRDGTVLGEGAGLLLIESYESAIKRGAKIHSEIIAYTSSCDAYNLTHPDPSAQAVSWAIEQTLKKANLYPQDIDYINAHGTATPLNDITETLAIKKALGDHAYKIKISAIKSMIGHLIAAAGVAGVIATILSIKNNMAFPTINIKNVDADCDLDYVANGTQEHKINIALCNSFGFGGFNSILALKKFNMD
ncbi:MAG: beta-ketoacyl-[acyl-carrier-protein] synthase family protein [Oligoflexia bacterium]|nr:beta-ketoacyl-[acyl-carrier-protein] synthase family protein [Oligoflexia bacterium]